MRLHTELETYRKDPARPLFLAVGNFDGLHAGHRMIIARVLEDARAAGGTAAVLTFRQHPQQVLNPDAAPKLLTSLDQKVFLLQEMGLDACFLLSFTEAFSKQSAEDFVSKVLKERLDVKKVYLGYSAHFGYARKGTPALMKELAARHGFLFEEIGPVQTAGEAVSSSTIRKWVESGMFDQARMGLGRQFSVFSAVVRGDGRGAQLGFPTANFDIAGLTVPANGVYPVSLRRVTKKQENLEKGVEQWKFQVDEPLRGAANLGFRPTFGSKGQRVLEAFIFDFKGELYGQTFEVIFHPRIREERAFDGPEPLKVQIGLDLAEAKRYFASLSPSSY